MKRSTTLILLVLTIGLGAWLLLREPGGPRNLGGHFLFDWSASVTEKEEVKVDVNAADVTGIDLKSGATEISLRKREDGGWEITKGVTDRADEAIVKQLLDYCSTARIVDTIHRDELKDGKVTAASLGLDDASAWRISWLKADGSSLAEIRAGLTAPLSNAGYVQVSGVGRRPDVYLVSPDLRPLFARPLDSFRDPRVSRYNSEQVQRMVVRKGEGEVEFSRFSAKEGDIAPWVISRPLPNAPAWQERVTELLANVCGAKIKDWVAYNEGSATGDGGEKPIVEVTLFPPGSGAKGSTLSFFPDPEAPEKTAICRDLQRKARFKVDWQIVDDLCLAESPDLFRSRKLAAVEPGIISTVQVTTALGESVLVVRVRDKWSWRPLAGGEWADAAPERLEKVITLLNDTEIIEFASDSLTDPAAFGLDMPAITLTMAAGAHLSLDQLTPMSEKNSQTLRIGIRQDGQIFANFTGDPFVYRVGPELPEGIPQSGLKWRSLAITEFSTRQIRSLTQTVGAAPPLELSYNSQTSRWSAARTGTDLTDRLETGAVEALATRLAGLTASAWLDHPDDANAALENPAVSIEIQIDVFDEKPSTSRRSTSIIELAPVPVPQGSNAPLCYGRFSGIAQPFLIDSRVLREMTVDLLRK